jgi:hypothetical protein
MRKVEPYQIFTLSSSYAGDKGVSFSVSRLNVSEVFDSAADALNAIDLEIDEVSNLFELLRLSTKVAASSHRGTANTIATNSSMIADLLKMLVEKTKGLPFSAWKVWYDEELEGTYLYYTGSHAYDAAVLEQNAGQFVLHPDCEKYVRKIVFK